MSSDNCEINSSDSVIPSVTHKLINYYVTCRYRLRTYPLKQSLLIVYVFIMELGKITINVGNHRNTAFHFVSTIIGRGRFGMDPLLLFVCLFLLLFGGFYHSFRTVCTVYVLFLTSVY